jgi:hypothetical protein
MMLVQWTSLSRTALVLADLSPMVQRVLHVSRLEGFLKMTRLALEGGA